MHDIGAHISFGRHHRHSYYLITNGDLRGFQPEEIEIMALVARYHRRSTPQTQPAQPAAGGVPPPAAGAPPDGTGAGRDAPRGRKPRSQPLAGDLRGNRA